MLGHISYCAVMAACTCRADIPFGFCFSRSCSCMAALCDADLCLFASRSNTRFCWAADAVNRICLRFGFGFVGSDDPMDDTGNVAGLSVVNKDTSASLETMMLVGGFSAKRRRIILRIVSFAMSFFENWAKIMACGTLMPVLVLNDSLLRFVLLKILTATCFVSHRSYFF